MPTKKTNQLFLKYKKIGYGLGYGGSNSHLTKFDEKDSAALKHAIKTGINVFDTAPVYGKGASERLLGRIIKKTKKRIYISTKVSPENLKKKNFIRSVKKSFKRIGKKIDFIQPHWPNYQISKDELIKSYYYLKKKKIVKYFGLSNYSLKDIIFFQNQLKSDFKFIQDEISLTNFDLIKKKIKFCEKHGIIFFGYSPLGSGKKHYTKRQKTFISNLSKKKTCSETSLILSFLSKLSKNIILLPHSKNLNHIQSNFNSYKVKIEKKDIEEFYRFFSTKFVNLKLSEINLFNVKSKNHELKNILLNKTQFSPHPREIAKVILDGHDLKYIKVLRKNGKYYLKEGLLRYWSNVIAYGLQKKLKFLLDH